MHAEVRSFVSALVPCCEDEHGAICKCMHPGGACTSDIRAPVHSRHTYLRTVMWYFAKSRDQGITWF